MSVAEFTLSYIARPAYSLNEKFAGQKFSVSIKRRGAAFIILFSTLVLLVASYLFLAGVIVSLNMQSAALHQRLERALMLANEAEADFIRKNNLKSIDFFAEAGFIKPAGIGVLERGINVVESKHFKALY